MAAQKRGEGVIIRQHLSAEQEGGAAAAWGHVPQPLPGLALRLDLAAGEHPYLPQTNALLTALKDVAWRQAGELPRGLPLAPNAIGHHVVADTGYAAAAGGGADIMLLAPTYVRDLAGRLVYTGLHPFPQLQEGDALRLPRGMEPLPAGQTAEDIESGFNVAFRLLDMATQPGVQLPAGARVRAGYPSPQAYPYKIRFDSFYQDGFRVPQTTRLAVNYGADVTQASAAVQAGLQAWQEAAKASKGYEAFYESQGADSWVEELFSKGVTLIPTFEAFNGYFQVTEDFGMADVWPGRAVKGLHAVVGERPDHSPEGTILEVRRPGFVTVDEIVPAQVVVSDGGRYRARQTEVPAPALPDPARPHEHTDMGAMQRGDVWLPTHPQHFDAPALWDWVELPEWPGHARLVQVSGPLWEPLHYVYASTPRVVRAFRMVDEANPWRAAVAEDMLPRFHPVQALQSYDTFNARTRAARTERASGGPLAHSALDSVPLMRDIAGMGYHALPEALAWRRQPYAFPETVPVTEDPLAARRCADAVSAISIEEAARLAVWLRGDEQELFDLCSRLPVMQAGVSHTVGNLKALTCYLPAMPAAQLAVNVKRFFLSKVHVKALGNIHAGLPEAIFAWREAALAWRRLRYRLVEKYPHAYGLAWLKNMALPIAEKYVGEVPMLELAQVRKILQNQQGMAIPVTGDAGVKATLPAQ